MAVGSVASVVTITAIQGSTSSPTLTTPRYCGFLDQLMKGTTDEVDDEDRHKSGAVRTWKFTRSDDLETRLDKASRRRNGVLQLKVSASAQHQH